MERPALNRLSLISITGTVLCGLVLVQVIRIQTSASHKEVSQWASETYSSETTTQYPERGDIYDRWGNLLASNMIVYEIGVDLYEVANPETIAEAVSSQAGLNYEDVLAAASIPYNASTARYAILADFVRGDAVTNLKELQKQYEKSNPGGRNKNLPSLAGLVFTPHLQRAYPEYSLASNVLGFYAYRERQDGHGYYGIEGEYDQLLAGNPVNVTTPLDPNLITEIPTVKSGDSLVLTIDREIQSMVEEELDKAVKNSGAASGTVIVLDPETGEILAMASTPRMNLNEYWKFTELYPEGTTFNRAIGVTYEPGSVFKVVTMAAALDAGAVQPSTKFLDTGYIEVGGVGIYNWDRAAWGEQDMTGCLQHSLNVCLSWVATQLGTDKFYQYLQAFGIGRPTNIDLSGEQYWPLSVPGDPQWYPVNLATNSFGQGVAVTPLQLAVAASAIANDGRIMQPHMVKAIIQDGQVYPITPQVIATPIKSDTAHTLTEMLTNSLVNESSSALVDGYRLAGKTGTAQIPVGGHYDSNITNASFVGWGPADDPKFLVYIWLEKPTTSIWGSVVAAPVFHDIVEQLVVLMNIPPDAMRQQLEGQQ
jgi:cell division protein FtsI/penicillin-binding protein 2